MTTLLKRTIGYLCLVLLIATPLTREVFAQSDVLDAPTSTPTIATTTENETIEALATADVAGDWFERERIFGNIDVGDFVVGPGRAEIEVEPGQTVIQEITVTNRISENRRFLLEIEDITGSADGSFAVSLTGDERGPYSVRDYISFPENEFELALGERARIPVTITIPPDAEPGGYYGGVLVSTIQTDEADVAQTAPANTIIARVGSLFFIRVAGDVEVGGETVDLTLLNNRWWYESGPINIGIVYENTGSVHVNPYGELSVTNMLGEEVGYVELEPWFVLPKSLRVREITWDREFLLGRYTIHAKVNRGYDDIVDELSVSFWVLPWKIVGGVFLVLFIVIFSIRAFFRTFEFKRKDA